MHPEWAPFHTLIDETPLTSFFTGKTFNNWAIEPSEQLDYITGSNISATNCFLENYREGNTPPSDHYPIVCELRLQ